MDHIYADNPEAAPLSQCDVKPSFTVNAKYADDITYAPTYTCEIDRTKVTVPGQPDFYNIHGSNKKQRNSLSHIPNLSEEIAHGANADYLEAYHGECLRNVGESGV